MSYSAFLYKANTSRFPYFYSHRMSSSWLSNLPYSYQKLPRKQGYYHTVFPKYYYSLSANPLTANSCGVATAQNSFKSRRHRPSPKFHFESPLKLPVSPSIYSFEARNSPTWLQRDGGHGYVDDREPPPYTSQATWITSSNEPMSPMPPVTSFRRVYTSRRSFTPHGDARVPILFNT